MKILFHTIDKNALKIQVDNFLLINALIGKGLRCKHQEMQIVHFCFGFCTQNSTVDNEMEWVHKEHNYLLIEHIDYYYLWNNLDCKFSILVLYLSCNCLILNCTCLLFQISSIQTGIEDTCFNLYKIRNEEWIISKYNLHYW